MNKQKSFTLIELLVVIVIIGILAGVIMISTSSSIDKANFAKAQAFSSTVQNELLSNLVSEWTFDEGSNQAVNRVATDDDVKDTWGNNHGKAYNGPFLREGNDCVDGKCLQFTGTNHVIIKIPVSGAESTISLWVKNPSGGYVLRSNANVRTYIFASGSFSKGDPQVSLGSVNYSKDWTYVVMTWKKENDQLSGCVFVNGFPLNANFINFSNNNDGTYIAIMSFSESGTQFGKGFVDNVRYYNAALSSSQIKQNYIAGLNSMLANGNISKQEYNERINAIAYDKE